MYRSKHAGIGLERHAHFLSQFVIGVFVIGANLKNQELRAR
jgi:hypothetical protein